MFHKAVFVIFVLAGWVSAASAGVGVTVEPSAFREVRFDPADPPADLPRMDPDERAYNLGRYQIEARLSFRVPSERQQGGTWTSRVSVTDADVTIGLVDTIYLPTDATPHLVAHEEGHRRINKHIWRDAEQTARAAAQRVVGRTFSGQGPTQQAARDAAAAQATAAVTDGFLEPLNKRSDKLHKAYDALTDHGREPIESDKAVDLVLKEHDQ